MACDINTLLNEGKCFSCLDEKSQLAVIATLLCDISASGGGGGSGVPSGVIVQWKGTIATIPSGWVLCNGLNGTPDLRNKFVVAADADSGGAAKTTLTGPATQSGGSISHTHSLNDPGHLHGITSIALDDGTVIPDTSPTGAFSPSVTGTTDPAITDITLNSTSAPQPYFALAYIMKS